MHSSRMKYKDLCKHLRHNDKFFGCLVRVLEAETELMHTHHAMVTWHLEREQSEGACAKRCRFAR